MTQTSAAASTAVAPSPARRPRLEVVDWLRGLAVVLMFVAHGFDAWTAPDARHGFAWDVIRFASGLPSRLFLLLVGVSAAIKLEAQVAKQVPPAAMRKGIARRGLEILVLAYLFRLQEHALAGFGGGWENVLRVDILNCIAASMFVLALLGVPRAGRPRVVLPLLGIAAFVGLGPVIGPAHFPTWLPRPLTSYLGGQRPMAWFTLFPFGSWALTGLLLGHWWVRRGRDATGQARVFLLSGAVGAVMIAATLLVRSIQPPVIRYPSELAQAQGSGSYFLRLGVLGLIATLGWLVVRFSAGRFSPLRQLGQTSLLLYWVHVDLCYGGIARPIRGKLSLGGAAVGVALLTLAMLGLSRWRTHVFPRWRERVSARRGALTEAGHEGKVPHGPVA